MASWFPHRSGLSYAPVCVQVYILGLTDRSQPIWSSACSTDPADVELVSQQEPCVGRTDGRPRDAGLVHTPWVLHWRRGQSHRTRALRREDVYPRNEVKTAMFTKGQKVESNIDLWHKRLGHVNFLQLGEMQTKNIVFRWSKWPSLWSLLVREAAPTSILQRVKSEPEPARFDPFGCVGTGTKCEHQSKSLLCNLHRWLQSAHLGVLDHEEEWSSSVSWRWRAWPKGKPTERSSA